MPGEVQTGEEELSFAAQTLRPKLKTTSGPLAVLASNGMTALVARQLANLQSRPLLPINPLLTATEIRQILSSSQAPTLLVESHFADRAEEALRLSGSSSGAEKTPARLLVSPCPVLADDEVLVYTGAAAATLSEAAIGATLIYTSGTTGVPKGCVRSAAQETARARELVATYSMTASDHQLIACPLAHSAPGIFVRACHAIGATSIILPKFSTTSFWHHWAKQAASVFFLVPTQYRRLLKSFGDKAPPPLRAGIVAGAPLPLALHQALIDWLPPRSLWQFYGSSETGTISISPPRERAHDSVGHIAPGVELEIRSETGALVAPGAIGELFVRSPTVMSGYHPNTTVDSADRLTRPFVSVGDLGYQDQESRLFLVDRKHDTIISGGVNVYPAQVEAVLLAHPQVQAAVVVGMEDKDWGQRVVALVAAPAALCDEALIAHCRQQLAGYKIPKEIRRVNLAQMPIGASGKPLRRTARAMLL